MTSRNAPCPCGSGKKFKRCHGLVGPNALYLQGVRLQLAGQLDAAVGAYRDALLQSESGFSANDPASGATLDVAAALQAYETAAGQYPGSKRLQQEGMYECQAEKELLELRLQEWESVSPEALGTPPSAHAVKFSDGWYNLGCAALANFTGNDRGVRLFHKALALNPANVLARMNSVFSLNYSTAAPAHEIAKAHRECGAWIEQHFCQTPQAFQVHSDENRPLRIGYLSSDFRNHPVAHFILPVLEQHDRNRFELYLYYNHEQVDEITRRAQSMAKQFRFVKALHDTALQSSIMADGIDILIDLNGYTKDNRLTVMAMRAAPVQVSWIGYPNTTGLKSVDYRIVDRVSDPPSYSKEFSSETLLYMPRVFLVYQPGVDLPEVTGPPNLESGHITFGSFNSMAKLNTDLLRSWAEILHEVKSSRILLKNIAFGYAPPRAEVLAAFVELGIDARRIDLVGVITNKRDHLKTYGQVDISLDSFPYNGTTTTCESLIMGVPVISRAGEDHRSRVGASILSAARLESLAKDSESGYIEAAIGLAGNPSLLASLRTGLRQRMLSSPLMDAGTFTRDLEKKFMQAWETRCGMEGNA